MCLKLSRPKLGADHPDTLSRVRNLAEAYMDAGRTTDALPLYADAVRGRRTAHGPDHALTMGATNDLATGYARAGRPADAVPLFEQVWLYRTARTDPGANDTRDRLGISLVRAGRPAEAEPHLLSVYAAAGTPAARNAATARLRELYQTWNRPADAARYREVAPMPRRG